jgi:protein-L-isoaspartate(D-aspartate) O-methyltransferase
MPALFPTIIDSPGRIVQTVNGVAAVAMNTEAARFNMIHQQIRGWNVFDPGVPAVLNEVRREDFVPGAYKELSFADAGIPLKRDTGPGQVMLAPRAEARLLQELAIRNTDKVLEIGAGSGCMAALLAAKAEFISVEIDPELADAARRNLQKAGILVNAPRPSRFVF